jgi:pathogenesis-related protein 1
MHKKIITLLSGFLLTSCVTSPTNSSLAPEEFSPAPVTTTTAWNTSFAKKKSTIDPAAMVAAHNQWRSKTGVPALKWSNNLTASAQQWADQLARSGCRVKHSTGTNGENIYWAGAAQRSDGTSSMQEITEQNVVDAWGNEVKDYDYASNSCHGVCGHYTQVVWKSTTEVGCGMAFCSDKAQVWVCQYTPPGNMVGKKPY